MCFRTRVQLPPPSPLEKTRYRLVFSLHETLLFVILQIEVGRGILLLVPDVLDIFRASAAVVIRVAEFAFVDQTQEGIYDI